jgi:hypothetical protein
MLRLLSRHLWATVLLVTMLGGLVTPLFGDLHAETDVVCADDVLGPTGHHYTTQIESVRPPEADGHCAVCHLQRALSGAADDAKRYVSGEEAAPFTAGVLTRTTRDSSRHDVPSRAPPAFFV